MAKIETPLQFLEWLRPAPWQLFAAKVDRLKGEPWADAVTISDPKEVTTLVKRWDGKRNLYYACNPLREDANPNKHGSKFDVKEMAVVHCDVDPNKGKPIEAERARIWKLIEKVKPEPSIIVDSGNGFNLLWRLTEALPVVGDTEAERIAAAEELERFNRHFENLLSSDHCSDLSRVLRLPFTWNLPGKVKRRAGRVKVLSSITKFSGHEYASDALPAEQAATEAATSRSGPVRGPTPHLDLPDDLPEVDLGALPLDMRWKIILRRGYDPGEPDRWSSRSECVFAAVCVMARAGMSDELIASALLDPDLGISVHVLDQGNPRQYAVRQIDRARSLGHG